MNRLRNRLILVFLAGTLVPLGAMLWITAALLQQSLRYADSGDLDRLSRMLEQTGRQLYRGARDDLREEVARGAPASARFPLAARKSWPAAVEEFWDSGDGERFSLSGAEGERLDYLVRRPDEVVLYTRAMGNVRMGPLSAQYRQARRQVEDLQKRDLRKGFTYTLLVLSGAVWAVSLIALAFVAHRISRPIRELTDGLAGLASGRYGTRLRVRRSDEVGRALEAFNETAEQLEENRDRLVYLTQVASWQLLARKTAHELKNSLTPIRLTVEEIVARQPNCDPDFLRQAAQIVIEEIETLERRVRAFSDFSSEPVPRPAPVDVNEAATERVEFLRVGHPEIEYRLDLATPPPRAFADPDHVKGILTNLLENAAEALSGRGTVLVATALRGDKVCIEVHDSGPGVANDVRGSLFEPTISFKKRGMGLGLSISRKNALLAGGDLELADGRLGGAAFRLLLPTARDV